MKYALIISLYCLSVLLPTYGYAVTPDERLSDAVLEEKARDISRQLRCPVCQNQSIDDSDADLARDLRKLVRERVLLGKSEAEILSYLQQRYGDFILLTPPVKKATYLLWILPFVLLIGGGIGFIVIMIKKRDTLKILETGEAALPDSLTEDEQQQLQALLYPSTHMSQEK